MSKNKNFTAVRASKTVFTLLFLIAVSAAHAQSPVSSPIAEGCVSGNCVNGRGKEIYSNGGVYEGDFVNYKKEGRGTYTFKNGDVYTGQWKNGKREGQGTLTFMSGSRYVGEFSRDNYNGIGTYYNKTNNTSIRAVWKDNVFVNTDSGSSSAPTGESAKQTKPADDEDEFDKIAREEGLTTLTPEQKRENAQIAKEMADAVIRNPKQYDKLLEVKEMRKETYEMIEVRFRQQAISKKFAEFDAAYRKPLSDGQRLELLNQIIPEYQKALKQTETLEKPTFNFTAEEKLKIAENKTYYTKVLNILTPMKAALQTPAGQTGAFSQAEQNPNAGRTTAKLQETSPEIGNPQITALNAKIAAASNDDKLYTERAALNFKIGKFADAVADADKALDINSQNNNALFLRGLAKGGKKDYDGAIADFSQVIKTAPNRAATAYFQRGRIYEQKGDFSKAIADYNKAAELDPKAVEAATKARLRTEARMNAANSGTTVGTALTQMKDQMEVKNTELRKLREYQEKFLALDKEAKPFLAKLMATAANDSENQRINRAALLPKAQAVRNYLADTIVELAKYKSPEAQKLRETFIETFKSVNGAIEKLY